MFGGFGRGFDETERDEVFFLEPRQVNYAKQALAALFWQDGNTEISQLHNYKHHFLYPYAFAQVRNDRLTPKQRHDRVLQYIEKQKGKRDENFTKYLVLATLTMKGFVAPYQQMESDEFLRQFETEARFFVTHNKTIENVTHLPQHLQEIVHDIQYDVNMAQVDKSTQIYYRFCENLVENGLPSIDNVREHLGERDAQLYHNDLDMIEADQVKNDVDIDEALQNGAQKRWNDLRRLKKAISAVSTYCETLPMANIQDCALHCEEWVKRNDRKSDERYLRKKEIAQTFGVWRIRHNEIHHWREAFAENNENIDEYLFLEQNLKQSCALGVFQHVQRRHYSSRSVEEMFLVNLPRYRELFPPPQ